ncbi:hypothetical protein DFH29DRAFT_901427 [Suillus ampliporus]|nr:hypothetical protein DFH29DRAFT_901427 [Suillus ampliporus]
MQLPNSIQTSMVDDSHKEPQTDINIRQFFADISQTCYPMDLYMPHGPCPLTINVLLARDNAIGASWFPQVSPTPDSIPNFNRIHRASTASHFPMRHSSSSIYPIELLKRLPEHLETYKDAFPEPSCGHSSSKRSRFYRFTHCNFGTCMAQLLHVLPTIENCENPENPEDILWSMTLKRGISDSLRPMRKSIEVQFGNMIYSAEETFNTSTSLCFNVFMELPRFPGPALEEPEAAFRGTEEGHIRPRPLSCSIGLPHSKCPDFPAVNLCFQNRDMNMLGVLDDLKFGTVDDATY